MRPKVGIQIQTSVGLPGHVFHITIEADPVLYCAEFDLENGLGGEKKDGASQRGQSICMFHCVGQRFADHNNANFCRKDDQRDQLDTGDEYQNLVRYISTYREGRRKSVASISPDDEAVKKPWWKFWAKQGVAPGSDPNSFEVPDDWLTTELKQGIRSSEVEGRRKNAGFNELTTEKVTHVQCQIS